MVARRPMVRDEAVREEVDDFLVPLKATGVISNPLSGKSTEQLNVEAKYTSSLRSAKCLIQFWAIGERPSATKRIRMASIYQKLPLSVSRSIIEKARSEKGDKA